MKKKEINILGVGNNTEVYIDLIKSCGFNIVGLFHYNDERTGESVCGIPIIDSNTNLFKQVSLNGIQFAVSVGDNRKRAELANQIRKLGGHIPTLIHPSAVVSKYAKIAEGVVIQANSVIQTGSSIDEDTVISYNVSITHHSSIGKACYIAFGSCIGAYVNILDNVFIGQAAIVVSGKVKYIGENSIIGAGSVVTKSVDPNIVVAGNPAHIIDVSQTKKK